MKILLVSSDNNKTSGAFLCMIQLAIHLRDDFGESVQIVLPWRGDGEELLKNKQLNYDIVETYDWVRPISVKSRIRHPLNEVRFLFKNKQILRAKDYLLKIKPDIVHVNTSWCFAFGAAAELLGIPLIWHIQEFLNEDQRRTFINRKYALSILKRASKIITISKSLDEKYRFLGLKNTKIILDGLDVNYYADKSHHIFANEIVNFLLVGGVSNSKGQFQICEWLGKLYQDQLLPSKFVIRIIGSCSKSSKKRLLKIGTKYNISDKLLILGPKSDVRQEYALSDIQFVNSKCEAFGRVTVEGILSGLCVLATNSGGSPEIIQPGKNGFLYRPNNFNDFKDKLLYILSNKNKIKNLIPNAIDDAINSFSSLRHAREVYSLYCEITKQK